MSDEGVAKLPPPPLDTPPSPPADAATAAPADDKVFDVVMVSAPDKAAAATDLLDQTSTPANNGGKSKTSSKKKKKKSLSDVKSVLESATASSSPNNNKTSKPKRTFVEMIHEAIVALKDRTGSSGIAIQKYILSEYSYQDNQSFRTRVNQSLKTGVKNQRFLKIRCSYKISAEWKKKEKDKRTKDNARKAADKKKRVQVNRKKKNEDDAKRLEDLKKTMSPEDLGKLKRAHEAKLEKQRKKAEAERIAKERADRLRKRRFPMEDTRLHNEDKEFGISSQCKRRPALPYLFQLTRSNSNSKSSASSQAASSRCDGMEHDSRGLVSDMLQVYHFFAGDLGFCQVAEFGLSNLVYAVDEVLNGNAKKSRLVPPLLTHLFVTALSVVCTPVGGGETKSEAQLHKDLTKLSEALNPTSWAEVLAMYMDCMDRYYTTSASIGSNVLEPGFTDVQFLFRLSDTFKSPDMTDTDIPEGYHGYFGSIKSTLARAFDKLNKQDPWTLNADELMALLRALCDDILATRPDMMVDISEREVQMNDLLRAKRSADSHFRKIKLAFEGPSRKPPTKKNAAAASDKNGDEKKKVEDPKENEEPNKEEEWKPTASKRQFEQAKRAQQKANNDYEKGLKNLIARTEPIGFDRHFNRYYSFPHDPEIIYVEMIRSPSGNAEYLPLEVQTSRTSWHVINKTSLLEQFAASLDVRGHRENNLHETLMGADGASHQSLKRYLEDDVKAASMITARKKEREELERKLENARFAVLTEEEGGGRRSGRLQTDAQSHVNQIESEIEEIDRKIKADETPKAPDYINLTGIEAVRKHDQKFKRSTRRARQQLDSAELPPMRCSELIASGDGDSSGLVGMLVEDVIEVHKLCLSLMEEDFDASGSFVTGIQSLIDSWNEACPQYVGPELKDHSPETVSILASMGSPVTPNHRQPMVSAVQSSAVKREAPKNGASDEAGKRRRVEIASPSSAASPSSQSVLSQIIAKLKQPILSLEERVYVISGLAMFDEDQNIADDNMSAAEEDEEESAEKSERDRMNQLLAWKRKIHVVRTLPAKKTGLIRENLVQAITEARKAHLGQIVGKLRSVLLLFHPAAAGDCKQAANALLEEYGGYVPSEDEFLDDDADEDDDEDEAETEEDEPVPSCLCFEATSLSGSLGDDATASRTDWLDAVKECKTISRLAALTTAFCHKASKRLQKLQSERQALTKAMVRWQKEEDRMKRNRGGKSNKKSSVGNVATEMWAPVRFTNEFCMVKVSDSPWWPAKKCVAINDELAGSLKSFGRVLVAIVGEHGELRCVKEEDTKSFTGKVVPDDDEAAFSKQDMAQLGESLAIARRIKRGLKDTPRVKRSGFADEKKLD